VPGPSNVIDIDEHRKVWIGGLGMCSSCGAMWGGVCHGDRQWELECPACNEMTGVMLSVSVIDAAAFADDDEYQARMVDVPGGEP
jgi:hypothetical protein